MCSVAIDSKASHEGGVRGFMRAPSLAVRAYTSKFNQVLTNYFVIDGTQITHVIVHNDLGLSVALARERVSHAGLLTAKGKQLFAEIYGQIQTNI